MGHACGTYRELAWSFVRMLPISSYASDSRYRYCQSLRSWYVPRAEISWYRSSYP
ncbi:hypothetical protein [Sorangium sp. So ce204]|uniref:hypothetical protein n=1 Tax=Sorangium sp. So ce204 TaxID=3133288 RepID=UPI003F63A238